MSNVRTDLIVEPSCTGGDNGQPPPEIALMVTHDGTNGHSIPAKTRLLRVLVVDDNRDAADNLAENLSTLVELCGHEVRVAQEEPAALDAMSVYQPDVLFVNAAARKMNGCQLVQQLRRHMRCEDTLLIAITSTANEAHRLLDARMGFDHYLVKPVDPSTIEELLLVEYRRLVGSLKRSPRPIPRGPTNGASLSSSSLQQQCETPVIREHLGE
jgi:CheY-like chemotaxis protein